MKNNLLTVTDYALLDVSLKKGKVGIALSGGVDSMVLFDILHKRIEKLGLAKTTLEVIHFHHGVREESDKEYEAVEELVKTVGAKFTGIYLDVETYQREQKLSFESAASHLRYQEFEKFYKEKELTVLYLAHHQNDLAESVVMKLVKGGYSKSLICMSETLYKNNVLYARPFLGVKKQSIYTYASKNNVLYFEDASNKDAKYTRNRYRERIIPLLEQENPKLSETLAQFSRDKADDEAYFDSVVNAQFEKLVESEQYQLAGEKLRVVTCKKREYLELPNALKKRLFFRLLKRVEEDEIVSIGHYEEFTRMNHENSSDVLNLSKNILYYVTEERIVFVSKHDWNSYMTAFDVTHTDALKVSGKQATTKKGRMKNFYSQIGLPIALRKHSYVQMDEEGYVQKLYTPFKEYDC